MNPLHKLDKEIFDQYPSEIWEAMMKIHPTHINHTTPFFGPMLYWIIRAIGAHTVVEIGIAQGYSSFFMAAAIKDNNIRFQMKGEYIAIDIADKRPLFDPMIAQGYPIRFIQKNSLEVSVEDLGGKGRVDLIFQDGWHNTKHCFKELDNLIYPALKDNGNGYLIMHDVYSWCEEYYRLVIQDPKYKFEAIRFMNNYGLALCRKMDNYDYAKIHWPDGDQKEEDGFVR